MQDALTGVTGANRNVARRFRQPFDARDPPVLETAGIPSMETSNMHQHAHGAALGDALTEQDMAVVMGGDGALWHAVGFAIGFVAGEIVKLNDVAQNPMSAGFVYHLYE